MAKPISVQLYSVREAAAKDFPGTLKKIADMGYAGVEFAGFHNHTAKDLAGIVKNLGMVTSSAHVEFPSKENIHKLTDDAHTLGYTYLVAGFGPEDMKTEDSVKTCADKFAAASELVKAQGLKLCMHNHWWEFDKTFGGKTPYEMILATAPSLFSELDIYWSTKAGAKTTEIVKHWSKRIPLLHVKDGDLGENSAHKAVGDGKVPISQIIKAADPASLEWVIVELDECDTDMFEAVAKSYKFLVGNKLATGRK